MRFTDCVFDSLCPLMSPCIPHPWFPEVVFFLRVHCTKALFWSWHCTAVAAKSYLIFFLHIFFLSFYNALLYTVKRFSVKDRKKGGKVTVGQFPDSILSCEYFLLQLFFQNPTIVYVFLKYTVKGFSALHTTHTINIFILFNFNFGGKNCGKQQ